MGEDSVELELCAADTERDGSEYDALNPRMMNRSEMKARYPYCKTRQKIDENADRLTSSLARLSLLLSARRPNFSSRLLVSTSICSPVALGSIFALTTSTSLVILPQMNQSSQTFPPIDLPKMLSEITSATSVRRQAFSRSSVGSRTARAP